VTLKPVVVVGYTLTQSDKSPVQSPPATDVTYTLTPTPSPAQRTTAEGKAVLLKELALQCTASGTINSLAYSGTGSASIVAHTPRVTCEGEQLLLEGDNVTVSCTGTVTTSSGTSPAASSVKVTITNAAQTTVVADDS
jgi:hypothetical protein